MTIKDGPDSPVGEKADAPSFLNAPQLTEIKSRLPAHVFVSSAPRSLLYVARSIFFVIALGYAVHYTTNSAFCQANSIARAIAWAVYGFLQGTVFWGIFTLGHDCGHGSFSSSSTLNWFVGNFLHTFILTPYESWRVSHRHHHKNTGNIDKDEIFFPQREAWFKTKIRKAPMFLGPAWLYYLVHGYSPRNVNHFSPFDKLFVQYKAEMRVAASVVTYAVWVGVLVAAVVSGKLSLASLMLYYLIPILVFGSWLVVVTFLHHQEEGIVWFGDEKWDYVKGNLSSIDRSYFPFDAITHNIGTHQIHHLFPIIPHYKLKEATEHFAKAYPQLVRKSNENSIVAFIKSLSIFMKQKAVPNDANVWVFSEKNNEDAVVDTVKGDKAH